MARLFLFLGVSGVKKALGLVLRGPERCSQWWSPGDLQLLLWRLIRMDYLFGEEDFGLDESDDEDENEALVSPCLPVPACLPADHAHT